MGRGGSGKDGFPLADWGADEWQAGELLWKEGEKIHVLTRVVQREHGVAGRAGEHCVVSSEDGAGGAAGESHEGVRHGELG